MLTLDQGTHHAHGDPLANALTLREAIAQLRLGNPWTPGTGAYVRRNLRLAELRAITAPTFGNPPANGEPEDPFDV